MSEEGAKTYEVHACVTVIATSVEEAIDEAEHIPAKEWNFYEVRELEE